VSANESLAHAEANGQVFKMKFVTGGWYCDVLMIFA
jgi:hypothetical protein